MHAGNAASAHWSHAGGGHSGSGHEPYTLLAVASVWWWLPGSHRFPILCGDVRSSPADEMVLNSWSWSTARTNARVHGDRWISHLLFFSLLLFFSVGLPFSHHCLTTPHITYIPHCVSKNVCLLLCLEECVCICYIYKCAWYWRWGHAQTGSLSSGR
jgi:hypothetical protein